MHQAQAHSPKSKVHARIYTRVYARAACTYRSHSTHCNAAPCKRKRQIAWPHLHASSGIRGGSGRCLYCLFPFPLSAFRFPNIYIYICVYVYVCAILYKPMWQHIYVCARAQSYVLCLDVAMCIYTSIQAQRAHLDLDHGQLPVYCVYTQRTRTRTSCVVCYMVYIYMCHIRMMHRAYIDTHMHTCTYTCTCMCIV
jgi:hypothetical protein